MPGQRIVGLVAMQVDAQAALGGDLAQGAHRRRAVRHRALEMRDAADHLDAAIERPRGSRLRPASGRSRPAGTRPAGGRDTAPRAASPRGAHPRRGAGRRRCRHGSGWRAVPGAGEVAMRRARSTTASCVKRGFSSPHSAMPSSSVPDSLRRGWPSESVASMWKWASTKGGETRWPAASSTGASSLEGGPDRSDPSGADGDILAGAAVGQGGVADDQVVAHGHSTLSAHRCP